MRKTLAIALLAALAAPGILSAAENTRFPPIPADKQTAKQKEFIKALTESPRSANGGGGNINNPPFKVYLRSPEFGIEAIKMSDYLRFDTGLENRLTELAIIIAARNWDNDYIWTAHYGAAVKGGLDPSVGADIAAGKRPTRMKEDEAIVYDLLTEIYRDRKVSDATFAKAVGKFGEKGIMDIIGLASYYGNTAMALIVSNGTRPAGNEPKLQKLTQNFPNNDSERPMKKFMTVALLATAFAIPGALIAAETQRFAPIDPKAYSPAQQEFARLMTVGPRAGTITNAPFKVYFASPEFGLEAIKMSNYLRWGTGLDARLSELAIMIAAREWTSDYIWHAHYPLAVKGGLDPSVGADIAAGKRPSRMKGDEAIIYDLLTEIYRDHDISDATYAKARAKYGEKGITDIQALASYYGVTAMALITAREKTAPGDEPKLQRLAQVFPN